jgi:hypothetical protein
MGTAMSKLHEAIGPGPMPSVLPVCSACRPAGAARDEPADDQRLRRVRVARLPPLQAPAPESTEAPSGGTPS